MRSNPSGTFTSLCLLLALAASSILGATAASAQEVEIIQSISPDGDLTTGRIYREGDLFRFIGSYTNPDDPSPHARPVTFLMRRLPNGEYEYIPNSGEPIFEPNRSGRATGISSNPHVVGYVDDGDGTPYQAFRYDVETEVIDELGTLQPSNPYAYSFATGANYNASVVVGYGGFATNLSQPQLTDGQHAFMWTPGAGMVDLGSGDGTGGLSRAFGVSDTGVVVGDSEFSGTAMHAFRWTQGDGYQDLGLLPGLGGISIARAITPDGVTIVGGSGHAFAWTNVQEGMVDLGALDGHSYSIATAISDNGRVIVGDSSTASLASNGPAGEINFNASSRGFRWTEATGMVDINQLLIDGGIDMTGITVIAATGLSSDGQYINTTIARAGNPSGDWEPAVVKYCDDAIDECDFAMTTPEGQETSVDELASARSAAATHLGGTADLMLGFLEPTTGGSEVGVVAGVGSFTAGVQGRWSDGPLTLLGGLAYTTQDYGSVSVDKAVIVAGAARYALAEMGEAQPFVEAGGWVAPAIGLTYTRQYDNGGSLATGIGSTEGYAATIYGRAGMVLHPADNLELTLAGSYAHNWLHSDAYAEAPGPDNPFPASFADDTTTSHLVKLSASLTAELTDRLDLTVSAAVGRAFVSGGVSGVVPGVGTVSGDTSDFSFGELGAKLSYDLSNDMKLDGFALVTAGEGIASHATVGVGLKMSF